VVAVYVSGGLGRRPRAAAQPREQAAAAVRRAESAGHTRTTPERPAATAREQDSSSRSCSSPSRLDRNALMRILHAY